ncbi:MAG: sigma-54-dependent Fis family transcriptional regulator, partial [Deltaproteobacteria bacterium]|nr:sigma-54-dependent Fis family transcriptional regulator [Deltaproteobacteria bacterium]
VGTRPGIWVEARLSVVEWGGRRALHMTLRDITEIKLKEMALEEEREQLLRENLALRNAMNGSQRFGELVGKSSAMRDIYRLILSASRTDANVVLYGESGTGKELVAHEIHERSDRARQAFVTVNCGAIPENLLESEFFGYKKGAFTGAHTDKHGYLDLADGGTLFLDEVAELSLNMQVKLLRAIDGGGYSPIGSAETKRSRFRIIAATNRDLVDRIRKGLMREDFFYRIHVVPIHLPPLRERRADIPLLIQHFLRGQRTGSGPAMIPGRIVEAMVDYEWPGNVRELQNMVHRYLTVRRLDFMETTPHPAPPGGVPEIPGRRGAGPETMKLPDALADTEKSFIAGALERTRWNRSRAAGILGISRRALFRKMKAYGLA